MAKLSDLDVFEVSLVDSPANKQRYLIVKSEDGDPDPDDEDIEDEDLKKAAEKKPDEEDEETKKKKKPEDEEEKQDATINAIKGALKIMNKHLDNLPSAAKKAVSTLADLAGYGYEAPKKTQKSSDDALKEIVKERDDFKAKVEKADARIQQLEDRETERELTELAKDMIGDVAENVKRLKVMKQALAKEDFDEAVKRENTFARIVKDSKLLEEVGLTKSSGFQTAYEKLGSIADGMVQKSEKLTKADAFKLACEQNPEIYKEYVADQRRASRKGGSD